MEDTDSLPTYTYRWNSQKKRPGNVLSEEEARRRFVSGEEFTVVFPKKEDPWPTLITFILEEQRVITSFLDRQGRKMMEYTYRKEKDDYLFLHMRNFWSYPNDNPKLKLFHANNLEESHQKPDGYTRRVIIDKDENVKDTLEYRDVPVEGNWVTLPEFGDWEELSRYDR